MKKFIAALALCILFSLKAVYGYLPQDTTESITLSPEIFKNAGKYERELFDVLGKSFPPEGEKSYQIRYGSSGVLIIAPHATPHKRKNYIKGSDNGTGPLAVMLDSLAGTTSIYTIYKSPSDPNYYDNNEFKKEVKRLVEELKPVIVLDLHAASSKLKFDIDFGTMHGKSLNGREELLERLKESFENAGLEKFSYNYFAAAKQNTITKWVSSMGVPAVQCEINARFLKVLSNDEIAGKRFLKIVEGFIGFINYIDENN